MTSQFTDQINDPSVGYAPDPILATNLGVLDLELVQIEQLETALIG